MSQFTPGFPENPDIAKAQAKRLRTALKPDHQIGHSKSLELIARLHGEQSWGRMNSVFSAADTLSTPIQNTTETPSAPAPRPKEASLPEGHLEQRAMQALYQGLKKARPTSVSAKARTKAKELARDEIISTQSFETWLDQLDVNLGGMVFDMHVDNLIKILKVNTLSRYQRPRVQDKSAYAFRGMRMADFAAALIKLDRFGFDTHPEVFAEPLLERIKKSRYIDESELTCLWYGREQKKFSFHESFFDAVTDIQDLVREDFVMPNGTKVSVECEAGDLQLIHRITLHR